MEPAKMWAVVELFGHQRIAGAISEQTFGGATFVRVDVPQVGTIQAHTRSFGPAAICIFDAGPTGNPYLDQGIRAEESARRAQLPEREDRGGGLTIYRPVLRWTVEQVFEQHRKHGIKPNPLYTQGMRRVGCMPCINVAKDELLEIGRRFPEHIDRIAEWEATVGAACRLSSATFIASPGDNETAFERGNIRAKLRWAQTGSGGHTIDWIRLHEEPAQCASAYGLCE